MDPILSTPLHPLVVLFQVLPVWWNIWLSLVGVVVQVVVVGLVGSEQALDCL
jgi:hypothetical protein